MGSIGLVTHGVLSESYFDFTYSLIGVIEKINEINGIVENIIEIDGILEGD